MEYFGVLYEIEDELPDSPDLELIWLQLRARSRGYRRNMRVLLDDAQNTTHFASHNEHDLVTMVYGRGERPEEKGRGVLN